MSSEAKGVTSSEEVTLLARHHPRGTCDAATRCQEDARRPQYHSNLPLA